MVQGARPAEGVRKGGEEPHLQKNACSTADIRRLPKAPAFTASARTLPKAPVGGLPGSGDAAFEAQP